MARHLDTDSLGDDGNPQHRNNEPETKQMSIAKVDEIVRRKRKMGRVAHRPGLYGHDLPADRHVFFNVYRAVDDMVPHGRIIGAVHHIDLHFDGT